MTLLPFFLLILLIIIICCYCCKSSFENIEALPFTVVIINLDRRPDRWNGIMNELVSKGFPEEIIYREPAVDGNGVHRKAKKALYKTNMNIWQNHLIGAYPTDWLLILEDDAELRSGYDYNRVVKEFNEYINKNLSVNVMRSNPGSCPKNRWGTEALFNNKKGSLSLLDIVGKYYNKKPLNIIPYDHFFLHNKKKIPHNCVGSEGGMFRQVGREGKKYTKLAGSDIHV
jgi:hypothetical protein